MELPDDVLALVREFSRPATRPDWRTLRRMTSYKLHCAIREIYNYTYIPVIILFVSTYDQYEYYYVFNPWTRAYDNGTLFNLIGYFLLNRRFKN
jgi:hypothetical protein